MCSEVVSREGCVRCWRGWRGVLLVLRGVPARATTGLLGRVWAEQLAGGGSGSCSTAAVAAAGLLEQLLVC